MAAFHVKRTDFLLVQLSLTINPRRLHRRAPGDMASIDAQGKGRCAFNIAGIGSVAPGGDIRLIEHEDAFGAPGDIAREGSELVATTAARQKGKPT